MGNEGGTLLNGRDAHGDGAKDYLWLRLTIRESGERNKG